MGDLVNEALGERRLGDQQREPVFLLDHEQRMHARGDRAVDVSADLGALPGEPAKPAAQQLENLIGGQRRDQR